MRKIFFPVTLLFCLTALALASPAYAIVVGQSGATYPIIEKDALKEIKQRVAEAKWKKQRQNLKKSILAYRPPDVPNLPRAKRDLTFMVDPTYTLARNIPDGKGGILYPKGYTFNPLNYISLPTTIIFLNGADRKQVKWFMKSPYAQANVMVLLTGGNSYTLGKQFQQPLFYASDRIVKRFHITAVPAVLYQEGKLLGVNEYEVQK